MKKVYLKTFGCQMNEYDSELIRAILSEAGFSFTDDVLAADVVLLNTCSVRENAARKVRGYLDKIRHDRGGRPAIYGILGCIATHLKEDLLKDRYLKIDFIAGPDSYKRLPELIKNCISQVPKCPSAQEKKIKPYDIELSDSETYEDIYPLRDSSVNAWIAIMRGCNNYCSYCVVPYTRGRERSRTAESIVKEAQRLSTEGFAQVTLLGQNVNSYHSNGVKFPELLKMVADIDAIKRVWFTSPHPKDFSQKLITLIARHPKICKHIHLPLQAGSTAILKKMNRPYNKEDYLSLVERIREKCPDIAITTDIIVGFPTETDNDFRDTVDVYQRAYFDTAFIFKYSPRKHTEAAEKFKNDVPERLKTERIVFLNELQKDISLEINRSRIGKTEEILVEKISGREIEGRTIQNKRVIVSAQVPKSPRAQEKDQTPGNMGTWGLGDLINVQITSATPHLLRGEILSARPVDKCADVP
ncbi:MAG: tRNA (N6-isopentenyl adenosine(37)-C2)-methylthiotransferase MiaB [Candidatus Omnitrophota bacterium]